MTYFFFFLLLFFANGRKKYLPGSRTEQSRMGSWCSWPWCRHRTSVHPTGSTLLRVAMAGRRGWARSGSWTWGTALWKQESGTNRQLKGGSDTVKQKKTPPSLPHPPAPSFTPPTPPPLFFSFSHTNNLYIQTYIQTIWNLQTIYRL